MVKSEPRMGKQKIEIKRIEDEVKRQVCFSKRRSSIFNKANELCVLCGADVAVVVFSPASNPYSFGHPSVNSAINRFLSDGRSGNPSNGYSGQGGNQAATTINELIQEHAKLQNMMAAERCQGKKIQEVVEKGIEGMGLDDLEKFKEELVGQLDIINTRKIQIMKERAIKEFQEDIMGIYGPPRFPLACRDASEIGVNPTPDNGRH